MQMVLTSLFRLMGLKKDGGPGLVLRRVGRWSMIIDSRMMELCFPSEARWVRFAQHRESLEERHDVTAADFKRHNDLIRRVHKMLFSRIGLR